MKSIRALALDVDGVLTDGTFWWTAAGDEMKRFSFRDVMAIAEVRRAGFALALISGENTSFVDRYAAKLLIPNVYKGCTDKATALRDFCGSEHIALSEVCFMGDDINDIPALKIAGVAAAPADAHAAVLAIATFVSSKNGGAGAVRELVDELLSVRIPESSIGSAAVRSAEAQS